jgi:hypothetical protein
MMSGGPAIRICIPGWYGLDSTGDEAILTQFIHEMVPDASVHLTIIAANKRRAYALYARPNVTVLEHRRTFGRIGYAICCGAELWRSSRPLHKAIC